MEVVGDVGLITCERMVNHHGAILLSVRRRSGFNPGVVDIEDGVPGRDQVECGREEIDDGEEQENDRTRTNNAQTHITKGMK